MPGDNENEGENEGEGEGEDVGVEVMGYWLENGVNDL